MQSAEIHISSVVVHVRPEALTELLTFIDAFPETEIYQYSAEGKIVVVIEATQAGFITKIIDKIQLHPQVFSTNMVYHESFVEDTMTDLAAPLPVQ